MPVKKKQIEEIKMPSDSELIQKLTLHGLTFGTVSIFGLIIVILIYFSLIGIGHGTLNTLHYLDIIPPTIEISGLQGGPESNAFVTGLIIIGLMFIPIYCFFSYKEHKQSEYKFKLRRQQL